MGNMQSVFWEVALTKDRDAFIRGRGNEYGKVNRPVRLDRSVKVTLFANTTSKRGGASVARAKARAKLWA